MLEMKRDVTFTDADVTTIEAAKWLGMSVRSVQLMVDRRELTAWKTPGGHRRIDRASIERWLAARSQGEEQVSAHPGPTEVRPEAASATRSVAEKVRMLLIDDSAHFQKLVSLLISRNFPQIELHVADDGIAGLALYGQLQPDVLLVDILLPGIDGAALIMSLRSHPQFARSRLGVVTSLDESQRTPYQFALEQVPVIHKPKLVTDLPKLLANWFPAGPSSGAERAA